MKYDEFFNKLWFSYPKNLCHDKKGTKFNAQKAAKKLPESEYERILGNMEALIRYDLKDPKPDRWPHLSTWLNQGYYDREIGSTAEVMERRQLDGCCIQDCNNEVHGPSFQHCAEHVPNAHSDLLAKSWESTGIKYKSPTFIEECRENISKLGYGRLIK